jgi:RND family efflux transporter MFP subunit
MLSRSIRHIALVLSALAAVAGAGCERQQQQKQASPPPPAVTVAAPQKRTVVDKDEYVGRFVAVDSVEIRARVSGYLEKVHFRDGQLVKKGDLLFTVDRRPFLNTVEQARASVNQAKANLAYTEADLARAQGLVGGSVISQQTYEQRTQAKRVAEANVAAQEAAQRQAELDLEFTELRAPVTGRIGDRRVSPGNLVTGGTTGTTTLLATIQTIDPIRFEFTMDETSYLRYQRLAKGGLDEAELGVKVPAKLRLIDEESFGHEGFIDFVDNAIDRSSGTIRGRAQFANPNSLFTPGMFARLQVDAGPPREALLVPDAAIGTEQVRKFVYVVDGENVAKPKYVTPGQLVENLRVVGGLDPGDRVIVNGLMRVRPGAKVTPGTGAPGAAAQK